MDAYAPEIEWMMRRLFDSLRENDRRRYAAIEAAKLGHGGIEYISRVSWVAIRRPSGWGLAELEGADEPRYGSLAKKGGGRKRLIEFRPGSRVDFPQGARGPHRGRPDAARGEVDELVAAADRQADDQAWGLLSVGDVVSQLLKKHGYRRRKALKKKTMGPRHPDRNAQFENIARVKKKYLKAGLPVISMDGD